MPNLREFLERLEREGELQRVSVEVDPYLEIDGDCDTRGEERQAGAIVMPVSPPFYHKPQTIQQMAEQFADKVLGVLGVETPLAWKPQLLE